MKWDFAVGDFVIGKRRTLDVLKIYEVLKRRQCDDIFNASTYTVGRRDVLITDLVESWPKIHFEAHYEKLPRETAKVLYGGTND